MRLRPQFPYDRSGEPSLRAALLAAAPWGILALAALFALIAFGR